MWLQENKIYMKFQIKEKNENNELDRERRSTYLRI